MANISEYVDLDALAIWKKNLNDINTSCLDYLDSFETKCLELKSVWSGNAATGFDENFNEQLLSAREHHNDLTDVNEFIKELAEIVSNQ